MCLVCFLGDSDTGERSQAAPWNDAPAEVLEQIMQTLPARECWNARRLCSSWAAAARRKAHFETAFAVGPPYLLAKMGTLSERVDFAAYPHIRFSLYVGQTLEAKECASFLAQIKLQIQIQVGCGRSAPYCNSDALFAQ